MFVILIFKVKIEINVPFQTENAQIVETLATCFPGYTHFL